MSKQIKNGQRPLSQKTRPPAIIDSDDVFSNPLSLDADMLKLIESKGFKYRWINYKNFVEMGGTHEAHWVPLPLKQLKEWGYDSINAQTFLFGSDADGYIRRKDLILGIRSNAINDKHKQYLRQEAARASMVQERTADAARELVGNTQGIKVHEGYQDDYNPEAESDEETA